MVSLRNLIILSVPFLLIAVSASAEPKKQPATAATKAPPAAIMQGITPERLKEIQDNSKRVQACIQEKGKTPLAHMRKMTEDANRKIDTLCAAGKRDEAAATVVQLEQEIAGGADMKVILSCSGTAEQPPPSSATKNGKKKTHVCDYNK